jgi:hypothetical protein
LAEIPIREFNSVRAIASATLAGVLLLPTGTMGEEKSLREQLVGAWIFFSSNGSSQTVALFGAPIRKA